MSTTAFDPIKYKQTTLAQWQTAAEAWNDYNGLLRRWLGPATELMLDMAGVQAGSRVLDVAAGGGGQSPPGGGGGGPGGGGVGAGNSPPPLGVAPGERPAPGPGGRP